MKPPGEMRTVATFSVIALMILVIACINFTNLDQENSDLKLRPGYSVTPIVSVK